MIESEQAVRAAAAHYKCGSYLDEDAYRYFPYLHEQGSLLPADNDSSVTVPKRRFGFSVD